MLYSLASTPQNLSDSVNPLILDFIINFNFNIRGLHLT
jgi:hypothetical protein